MSQPRIVVLDYGSGNLRSAERAVERVGAEVTVTSDTAAAYAADGLVVPGVGAYAACMVGYRSLEPVDGTDVVSALVRAGRPVLGICVGMQVLFTRGEEHGVSTAGLGLVDGVVSRLDADVVPHMGWNVVDAPDGSALFRGIAEQRFYFVHSYAAKSAGAASVTWAEHGEAFVAALEHGPLTATQFHPEKSGDAGAHLLENWLSTLR
jgi:imidazole glycerol-phosphate synthase subunit HisH